MKPLNLLTTLAFITLATAAAAEDWAGKYYGMSLGYVDGTSNHSWALTPQGVDVSVSGAVVGFSIGQNFTRNTAVFGYEATLGLSGANGFDIGAATPCITVGEACNSKLSAYATLKGRAGIALENGFMPYISAGLAAGSISATADTGACSGLPCSIDKMLTGYVVGLGVEKHMQNGWNLTADYSYMAFGSERLDGSSIFGNVKAKFDYSILSIGVSRRF